MWTKNSHVGGKEHGEEEEGLVDEDDGGHYTPLRNSISMITGMVGEMITMGGGKPKKGILLGWGNPSSLLPPHPPQQARDIRASND